MTLFSLRAFCYWLLVGPALLIFTPRLIAVELARLSPDGKGFVLGSAGQRFVPWGHNYGSVDIMERLANDPDRVEREFAEMKAAGTTVARVHPEMPAFFRGRDEINGEAIQRLRRLLTTAERTGIYLQITGLACYQIKDRMEWYDALDEAARWKTQELFWAMVAETCSESPAVFCYDLINEPAAGGKVAEGWYMGRMGDVEFCQRLTLNPGDRKADEIFGEWTKRMVGAIRKHDSKHMITLGMLPFPGSYKAAVPELDFVSPHLYPKTGKVDEEIELLKKFDFGKPIVIGETFPLTCSAADEREFLLKSRGLAQGWIGHWPDKSPAELAELKREGKANIEQAIWLSWVELFQEVGAEMKN